MSIGSLFSGIGGLELGLEWAGFGPVKWQVEIEPFCRAVLARHWPNAKLHEDVCHVGKENLEPVDILCGGFPCQDISLMGSRKGLDGERSGLWREYSRIIDELAPRAVVIENVAALATQGLDRIVDDLGQYGYRVAARLFKALDVGAPHKRERLFIVAYRDGERREGVSTRDGEDGGVGIERRSDPLRRGAHGGEEPSGIRDALAEPSVGRDPHGVSARVVRWPSGPKDAPHAWEPPRLIVKGTDVPNRRAQLRAYGNAVVPECAYEVGRFVREVLGT